MTEGESKVFAVVMGTAFVRFATQPAVPTDATDDEAMVQAADLGRRAIEAMQRVLGGDAP